MTDALHTTNLSSLIAAWTRGCTAERAAPRIACTNSDQIQLLCPGGPLQIEVKGHLNASIMAWYCKGVDMGVK